MKTPYRILWNYGIDGHALSGKEYADPMEALADAMKRASCEFKIIRIVTFVEEKEAARIDDGQPID